MGSPLNLSAHFLSAHIQRQTKLKGIDTKKFIPVFVCVILFSACQQSKQGIVKDLLEAENSFEKEKVNQLLSDSFMFYGPETLNKDEYFSRVDSLKSIECQSTILKIQVLDSIVKTEEQERSIIDSLLEVTPAIIRYKTYRFVDDKLLSITVDSTLHFEEYYKSLNEKVVPFTFYVNDQYDIEDGKELYANIKKYLSEYVSLPTSDKKQYKHYAHLQGTYVSKDCAFYRKLIFRGKKTVTIVDAIFGMSFASGYELDEDIIRVKTIVLVLFDLSLYLTVIGYRCYLFGITCIVVSMNW